MANFTLNIGAEPVSLYTVTENILFSKQDCVIINEEHSIGLIKTTNTYNIYYLLQDYVDPSSWKTLKIKNVVYSNPTGFYLSDTLVKIPEAGATVYNFDITGQTVDVPIADLTLTYDNLTLLQSETIRFDLAIENLALTLGPYVSVQITLKKLQCIVIDPLDDITITQILDTGCWREIEVEVHVPLEESRYVTSNVLDAFSQILVLPSGSLPLTITQDTTFRLIIDASTAGGAPWTYTSVATLIVTANPGSNTIISSAHISRNHNGNIC